MTDVAKSNPTRITLIAAIVLTVIYVVWSWYVFSKFAMQTPPNGSSWDHAMVIYNGVASIGFAAIGVLLGTQVQQTNVARAHEEAAGAKADAAKKGEVIKRVEELTRSEPDDRGGGPSKSNDAPERLEQIRQELFRGL